MIFINVAAEPRGVESVRSTHGDQRRKYYPTSRWPESVEASGQDTGTSGPGGGPHQLQDAVPEPTEEQWQNTVRMAWGQQASSRRKGDGVGGRSGGPASGLVRMTQAQAQPRLRERRFVQSLTWRKGETLNPNKAAEAAAMSSPRLCPPTPTSQLGEWA